MVEDKLRVRCCNGWDYAVDFQDLLETCSLRLLYVVVEQLSDCKTLHLLHWKMQQLHSAEANGDVRVCDGYS